MNHNGTKETQIYACLCTHTHKPLGPLRQKALKLKTYCLLKLTSPVRFSKIF